MERVKKSVVARGQGKRGIDKAQRIFRTVKNFV